MTESNAEIQARQKAEAQEEAAEGIHHPSGRRHYVRSGAATGPARDLDSDGSPHGQHTRVKGKGRA